jgi:hypothetical protein
LPLPEIGVKVTPDLKVPQLQLDERDSLGEIATYVAFANFEGSNAMPLALCHNNHKHHHSTRDKVNPKRGAMDTDQPVLSVQIQFLIRNPANREKSDIERTAALVCLTLPSNYDAEFSPKDTHNNCTPVIIRSGLFNTAQVGVVRILLNYGQNIANE